LESQNKKKNKRKPQRLEDSKKSEKMRLFMVVAPPFRVGV
jgi:hypothetical protein